MEELSMALNGIAFAFMHRSLPAQHPMLQRFEQRLSSPRSAVPKQANEESRLPSPLPLPSAERSRSPAPSHRGRSCSPRRSRSRSPESPRRDQMDSSPVSSEPLQRKLIRHDAPVAAPAPDSFDDLSALDLTPEEYELVKDIFPRSVMTPAPPVAKPAKPVARTRARVVVSDDEEEK